ncbi:ankyrin repeat domain-containing protein [Pseudomonas sp. IT-P294]|jgi:hypothetical protein|uniref:ankyrin repeat domain-containing protein n=1 Tax=Pseudomonas sp. IT-P294 TaxID=3026454 RepID=UPI0039DFE16A
MNTHYSSVVKVPKGPVHFLAIDVCRIEASNQDLAWCESVARFTRQWAFDHPDQKPATLWMLNTSSTLFDGRYGVHLAASTKLPENFVVLLGRFMEKELGSLLRSAKGATIGDEQDWQPLFHFQDDKVWTPQDLENWTSRDLSPVERPPSEDDNRRAFSFRIEPTVLTEQQLNTREFNEALNSGDVGDLERYIRAHSSIIDCADAFEKGNTPLHLAAEAGDVEACRLLFRYVQPDIRNHSGQTPLIQLSMSRRFKPHAGVVELFASTINETDQYSRSALMHAADGQMITTRMGNLRLVKLLVDQGSDLKMLDAKGRTALGLALARHLRSKPDANIEVIEWLKKKTYEQSVDRYFRTHYDHHFDEKGLLNIRKR